MTKVHLQDIKVHRQEDPLPMKSAKTLIAIQNKLTELEIKYPGILHEELFDFLDVLEMGAKKYAPNNWLQPNGTKSSERDMHASMGRHWAQNHHVYDVPYIAGEDVCQGPILKYEKKYPKDPESNLDPSLHLACRAMMVYTRRKRGLVHDDDK